MNKNMPNISESLHKENSISRSQSSGGTNQGNKSEMYLQAGRFKVLKVSNTFLKSIWDLTESHWRKAGTGRMWWYLFVTVIRQDVVLRTKWPLEGEMAEPITVQYNNQTDNR